MPEMKFPRKGISRLGYLGHFRCWHNLEWLATDYPGQGSTLSDLWHFRRILPRKNESSQWRRRSLVAWKNRVSFYFILMRDWSLLSVCAFWRFRRKRVSKVTGLSWDNRTDGEDSASHNATDASSWMRFCFRFHLFTPLHTIIVSLSCLFLLSTASATASSISNIFRRWQSWKWKKWIERLTFARRGLVVHGVDVVQVDVGLLRVRRCQLTEAHRVFITITCFRRGKYEHIWIISIRCGAINYDRSHIILLKRL